jgi:hypothetical protein
MCVGSAAGVIVGGEGAANGAGATARAGFVAPEPGFEAIAAALPLESVVTRGLTGKASAYFGLRLPLSITQGHCTARPKAAAR